MAITAPLLLIRVASQPPQRMAIMLTTPKGMLKRIVWNLSKPKDCTIRGPKVPIPPDGMLDGVSFPILFEEYETSCDSCPVPVLGTYEIAITRKNQHQDFGSSNASTT